MQPLKGGLPISNGEHCFAKLFETLPRQENPHIRCRHLAAAVINLCRDIPLKFTETMRYGSACGGAIRHSAIAREPSVTSGRKFLRDESGATAIEYGLMAASISIAITAWFRAWATG